MTTLYDCIGATYARHRRPYPRIAAIIHAELAGAQSVLNVGAGTGSYEPSGIPVTAVEPSAEMNRQRPPGPATIVQARAEELPFSDQSFDASMAILTVHHWTDAGQGLRELRRVTRGKIVILTFDPDDTSFWLLDYLPALAELDRQYMPRLAQFQAVLGAVQTVRVPIPHDCIDGLLCAYWRRPSDYLDPDVRKAMSSFSKVSGVEAAMIRLEADIASGDWARKNAHLLEMDACDMGCHLVVSDAADRS